MNTADLLSLLPLPDGAHLAQFRTASVLEMHRALRVYSHAWLRDPGHPRSLVLSFQGVEALDAVAADRIRKAIGMAGCTIVGVWSGSEGSQLLSSTWDVPLIGDAANEEVATPIVEAVASVEPAPELTAEQIRAAKPRVRLSLVDLQMVAAIPVQSEARAEVAPVLELAVAVATASVPNATQAWEGQFAQAIDALHASGSSVAPASPVAEAGWPTESAATEEGWETRHANFLQDINDRMGEFNDTPAVTINAAPLELLETVQLIEVAPAPAFELVAEVHQDESLASAEEDASSDDVSAAFTEEASRMQDELFSASPVAEAALPWSIAEVEDAPRLTLVPRDEEAEVPVAAAVVDAIAEEATPVAPLSEAVAAPVVVDCPISLKDRLLQMATDMVNTIQSTADQGEGQLDVATESDDVVVAHSCVHAARVRSGMRVVAPQGQVLVVEGDVSPGGELLSESSIHVYGALRGRAFAGMSGDRSACIYTQCFDPQLVSIAGFYKLFEEIPAEWQGRPAKIWLDESNKLMVKLLGN